MNKIIVNNRDGKLTVSSLQVATDFGKQHKHVLETIENIKAENSAVTKMFIESAYKAGTGKSYKCYDITRDGFSLLVMGFTGKKALEWKLKYIEAFNAMEQQLYNNYKQLSFDDKPDDYEYYDKTYNGIPVLTIEDISHLFNITKQNINHYFADKNMQRGTDYCLLKEKTISDFKMENPKITKTIPSLIIVYKSGFIKLCKIMNIKCSIPDCYCIEEKKTDIVSEILKDFGIKQNKLTRQIYDKLIKDDSSITGNSMLVHFDDCNDEIYFDTSADKYEKLAIIMQNIGYQLLGGFRNSIDGKPISSDEIENESKIFSAVFLAMQLFIDYGGLNK